MNDPAYNVHKPDGCKKRNGKAALRMEAEHSAHAIKVLNEFGNSMWNIKEKRPYFFRATIDTAPLSRYNIRDTPP